MAELTYTKVGDYYLPDLVTEPHPDRSLGKYGLLRLRYLKEHRSTVWAELVMEGTLFWGKEKGRSIAGTPSKSKDDI